MHAATGFAAAGSSSPACTAGAASRRVLSRPLRQGDDHCLGRGGAGAGGTVAVACQRLGPLAGWRQHKDAAVVEAAADDFPQPTQVEAQLAHPPGDAEEATGRR